MAGNTVFQLVVLLKSWILSGSCHGSGLVLRPVCERKSVFMCVCVRECLSMCIGPGFTVLARGPG